MPSQSLHAHGATRPSAFLAFLRQHATRFPVATLARSARLSRSTVSRALAGKSVTVSTLEAILGALRHLGVKADLLVVIRKGEG